MKWIITDYRKDQQRTWYVCARPGWMRCADGHFERDGSLKGGPEWTLNRGEALEFQSHRAVARVAGKCPSAKIVMAEMGAS